MKIRYAASLAVCLLGLNACKQDKESVGPSLIAGRWQLTQLECYCVPGAAVPNEAVEFDKQGNVTFYANGQVASQGTYQFTTGRFCGGNSAIPVLRISNLSGIYDNNIAYTVSTSELVLDQGLCTDAPRKTYKRQ